MDGLDFGGLLFFGGLRGLWRRRWLGHDAFQGLALGFRANVAVTSKNCVSTDAHSRFATAYFSYKASIIGGNASNGRFSS